MNRRRNDLPILPTATAHCGTAEAQHRCRCRATGRLPRAVLYVAGAGSTTITLSDNTRITSLGVGSAAELQGRVFSG